MRIYRGKEKLTGKWAVGVPIPMHYNNELTDRIAILKKVNYDTEKETDEIYLDEINPETLGEFTGLYDSTKWEELSGAEQKDFLESHKKEEWQGKPIFTGDILKISENKEYSFIVGFGKHKLFHCGYDNGYGYYVSGADAITKKCFNAGLRDDILFWLYRGYKVAGNVIDNPELLEELEKN